MEINVQKTKLVVFSKDGDVQSVAMNSGVVLQQIASYRYLGSLVTEDSRSDMEIKSRIATMK